MKPIRITLLESPRGYIVKRFSNTTLLAIGEEVARERVAKWCETEGVEVVVIGKIEDRKEALKL